MAPRARNKFGDPMPEPKMFRKQMCCTEGSACDIVGTFRLLPSDSAPGTLCPFVAPLLAVKHYSVEHAVGISSKYIFQI